MMQKKHIKTNNLPRLCKTFLTKNVNKVNPMRITKKMNKNFIKFNKSAIPIGDDMLSSMFSYRIKLNKVEPSQILGLNEQQH
jgi:hypothetical protein